MQILLDTNIVVSGFLFKGTPSRLIEAAYFGHFLPWTSKELVNELITTLAKKKLRKLLAKAGLNTAQVVAEYSALACFVGPIQIVPVITADPDDDVVLATGVAANVDVIVTGDHHLLALRTYRGIQIITAADACARLGLP